VFAFLFLCPGVFFNFFVGGGGCWSSCYIQCMFGFKNYVIKLMCGELASVIVT